ncbi:hypothetical protein TcasGA2_TC033744 [Tribolium castaneum]|uniref:Peptidase S1 domain-containing protein n=1 Tax=Tribolium castaneum TaxID=7070 RepID=A0A139WEW1_TRICA|nr:hypothetical protein TcasGA2_TC033744 [Tribolium castaneum]
MMLLLTFFTLLKICLAAEVTWNEVRFVVSLNYKNYSDFCSGTFVRDRFTILTAASCFSVLGKNYDYKSIEVHVNSYPDKYLARYLAIHPKFSPNKPGLNDVALIALKPTFISLLMNYAPYNSIQLFNIATVNKYAVVFAVELDAGKGLVHKRMLTVVSSEEKFCKNTESTVCAKDSKPDQRCGKNFGGPVVDKASGNLVGIIAYKPKSKCSPDHAEGFVRLSNYIEWIDDTLSNLSSSFLNYLFE